MHAVIHTVQSAYLICLDDDQGTAMHAMASNRQRLLRQDIRLIKFLSEFVDYSHNELL